MLSSDGDIILTAGISICSRTVRFVDMPFLHPNGKEIYYTRQPAKKEAESIRISFLMIHGLGSSTSFYAPIIPRLTASGFDCIALDTYGEIEHLRVCISHEGVLIGLTEFRPDHLHSKNFLNRTVDGVSSYSLVISKTLIKKTD
jgi:hypothetical protein